MRSPVLRDEGGVIVQNNSMTPSRKQSSWPGALRSVARYTYPGWSLVAPVLIGVFGGRWLDGWLGTEPWLFIAGSILGIAVGFYQFFTSFG
jgi:hypothetical protein